MWVLICSRETLDGWGQHIIKHASSYVELREDESISVVIYTTPFHKTQPLATNLDIYVSKFIVSIRLFLDGGVCSYFECWFFFHVLLENSRKKQLWYCLKVNIYWMCDISAFCWLWELMENLYCWVKGHEMMKRWIWALQRAQDFCTL